MTKYYYASIINKNLYIGEDNLLDYLGKYFPNIYAYYQESFSKDIVIDFSKYRSLRISFNIKAAKEGISFYLLLKKDNGQFLEIHTNEPIGLSDIKNTRLKELTKEELDTLYADDYTKRINKYIYYLALIDNNPIFDLDYVLEKKFKIIKKQTRLFCLVCF